VGGGGVGATHLLPDGAAHGVQGVGDGRDGVERVDGDGGLWRVGADTLGERWSHVHADRLDLPGAGLAEFGEQRVEGGGVLAGLTPDDLLTAVVGDQGEVVVALLPADLVHPDVDQPVQPVAVQLVGGDPLADASDGVPVQAQEPADGALVGLGGQERGHVLQVAGEPRTVPGKGHRLGHHPVDGAVQAP